MLILTNNIKMNLTIKITDDEAQHLYHSSMHCFYHDQVERFEFTNKTDEENNIMDNYDDTHTFHFCEDNILNAIILKNYLITKGFDCVILWDMAQQNYAVVSSQLWNDYMNKNSNSNEQQNINEDNNSQSDTITESLTDEDNSIEKSPNDEIEINI